MNKYVLVIDKDQEYSESVILGHREATQQIIKFYYNNCMNLKQKMQETGKLYTDIVADTLGVIIILVCNGSLLAYLPEVLSESQLNKLKGLNNKINEINKGKSVYEMYKIEHKYKDSFYKDFNKLEDIVEVEEKVLRR